ncbi:MAG: alanine--tRNA ligase [Fimbriimonadales bacterium]|nr:alanine--tRNA ligase [Fimbriimonadales bacterium]
MTARELREKYLRFFETKGHQRYPSGSLIPYDVTGKLDESLLFNGAGMVQFKPFFRGAAEPSCRRLTTAQKCVRTGDIDSVGDHSHLTFFEMLGNFSFGDYFKEEAIALSWEFLTSPDWLGLDPRRLAFTVFEEDDEAFELWSAHLREAGIDPATRVFRLGEETNYWPAGAFSSGPPGPCGPNTEMFYWVDGAGEPPSGAYSRQDYLRDEKAGKWLEIWNDVFIQYEWRGRPRNPDRPSDGYEKEGMDPLPFRSVDTGMGLERTAAVLAGHASVYATDVFQPIFRRLEEAAGGTYAYGGGEGEQDTAARIIADHIRTAVFCIADGILPGNSGRGYVLRRLIRRAVLKGQRVLRFEEPFFHRVYEGVAEAMADAYPELTDRRETIVRTLLSEERLFRRTLAQGSQMLADHLRELRPGDTLDGQAAFRLYDTYGFPLEVTREICAEAGVAVDSEGFEAALAEAQRRSRSADGMETVYAEGAARKLSLATHDAPKDSTFVGYRSLEHRSRIVRVEADLDDQARVHGRLRVALEETPFYAESGGQVADVGTMTAEGLRLGVLRTWKVDGTVWHDVEVLDGPDATGLPEEEARGLLSDAMLGREVLAEVPADRRKAITRNHTATHLLHAALRSVLGTHVAQAGSLVHPEYLRFDFTHGQALSPEELEAVERLANRQVWEDLPVSVHEDLPLAEARARGAMALFGEKYGERVRMVEVEGFSRELCGGCHVGRTGEIGLIKIVSEGSAASGVRRIEALTGERAYDWVLGQQRTIQQAAALLKAPAGELVSAVEKTLDALREERRRVERLRAQSLQGSQASVVSLGSVELATQRIDGGEQAEGAAAADRLVDGRPSRVAVVAVVGEGKVSFVCKAGADALRAGAHAGNLVREVAKVAGGGGGGRADFATAGGRNPQAADQALQKAAEVLKAQVGA